MKTKTKEERGILFEHFLIVDSDRSIRYFQIDGLYPMYEYIKFGVSRSDWYVDIKEVHLIIRKDGGYKE